MISFFKRLFSNCCPVCPPAPPVPVPPAPPSPTVCPIVPGPTIAIVNISTVISDAQIAAATAALQVQLDRDFAPVWNMTAHLVAIPSGQQPAADAWVIYIMDTSDQAGALGYHDLTPAGNPVGKVFAKDDKKYGLTWTVTLSHELLEMIADPWICNVSFDQKTNTTGTLYAWEVCDACLTGDTLIPLLDGTSRRIDELIGLDEFYVYSSTEDGRIRPGRGHSARVTRKNAEIVEVVLDNNESFRCTPDHLIMRRDGSYIMAGDLQPGDSLMPLYRRRHPISDTNKLDYEQVFEPATNEWKFTHRIVEARCPQGYVRHHKDFNRFNNSPDNLEIMTWNDHQELHQADIRRVANLPQTNEARRKRFIELNKSHKGKKRPELCVPHNLSDEERIACGKRGRKHLLAYNGSEQHLAAIRGNSNMKKLWEQEVFRELHRERGRKMAAERNQTPEHLAMLRSITSSDEFKKIASDVAKRNNHERWHVSRNRPSPNCEFCVANVEAPINHKVKEIRKCDNQDVYDITVDEYHNFAIDAGVFVHNCEADQFGYTIDGILVSDFVYPTWFEGWRQPGSAKFDQQGVLKAPLSLAPGGYIGIFTVPTSSGWTQKFAETKAATPSRAGIKGPYGRIARRRPITRL